MDWALENKTLILSLLIGILALAGGRSLYQAQTLKQAKKASEAFFEAKKLGPETEAGAKALEKVGQDFSGTQSGWEALMLLGDSQAKKDPKSEQASAWYSKAEGAASEPRQKLLTRYALAYSFERQGKLDQAIQEIENAQRLGLSHLKAELALNRARLLERTGKKEEALKAYDSISSEFSGSDAGRTAELWKAQIR